VRRLDVLVSGAGIAGCTLAYWLARYGHSATVVERSGALRSSGVLSTFADPQHRLQNEWTLYRDCEMPALALPE
jgi:2-polyprenyl-6-methoxyphenol hydroxylase-like FAD-dependent oxidoreductase